MIDCSEIGSKKIRKIRILFIIDQIYDLCGGTEQNLFFLLRHLPIDHFEFSLVVLRETCFRYSKLSHVETTLLNLGSFYSLIQLKNAILQLSQLLSKKKIDIVHTFFPDSELLSIFATKMGRQCTLIASRRNMGFRHTRASLWRTRFTNKFIHYFIVNSNKVKEHIGKLEWIPHNKLEVIYNPLQKDRVEDGLRKLISREYFGINKSEKVVGIVANITPVKDYSTFLHAARLIININPQTKFMMVGGSTLKEKQRIDSLISNLGLGKNVIYVGKHDNPISLMRLFDVGVLCSTSEGLSNSLIEYAGIGVPAVATNVGGNSEIVIHGKTGFLVPPGSPEELAKRILDLLNNDNLRISFGKSARHLAIERFDQTIVISAYENFYRRVINLR